MDIDDRLQLAARSKDDPYKAEISVHEFKILGKRMKALGWKKKRNIMVVKFDGRHKALLKIRKALDADGWTADTAYYTNADVALDDYIYEGTEFPKDPEKYIRLMVERVH